MSMKIVLWSLTMQLFRESIIRDLEQPDEDRDQYFGEQPFHL